MVIFAVETFEQGLVWQHLHASNMVVGNGSTPASSPWSNPYQFTFDNNRHYLCLLQINGDRAHLLDSKLDNGLANSGTLLVLNASASNYENNNQYDLCYLL